MTSDLCLLTWRLEMNLAEGGSVNREGGDLGYNITLPNTQISCRRGGS